LESGKAGGFITRKIDEPVFAEQSKKEQSKKEQGKKRCKSL